MNIYVEDPGDRYDSLKWDFDENVGYSTIYIDGYPYKVLKNNKNSERRVAKLLHQMRNYTNILCNILESTRYKYPQRLQKNIDLFLDIHQELPIESLQHRHFRNRLPFGTTSSYLLSQIPPNTGFSGLNKPKERYISDELPIGKDKKLRANYRDIFFDISPNTTTLENNKKLLDLLLHELAHTGCNHVRWRPDDHGKDFKEFEKVLHTCTFTP